MPSQKEIYLLAAEVGCVERTVRRWLDGESVNGPTAYALEAAAKRLKIELPTQPEPNTATG